MGFGKRTAIIGLGILSMALLLVSCRKDEVKTSMRSVYYWSTTLNMDSTKTVFIKKYSISRVYLRYFDVVDDEAGRAMPNATLSFATKVPQGIDIVPTVFVMPECLRHDRHHLARLIVRRVLQMSQNHQRVPVLHRIALLPRRLHPKAAIELFGIQQRPVQIKNHALKHAAPPSFA